MMEVERKWLVDADNPQLMREITNATKVEKMVQGYLVRKKDLTSRIRTIEVVGTKETKAIFCTKMPYKHALTHLSSHEYEDEIKVGNASSILRSPLVPTLTKTRYTTRAGLEIDVFGDDLEGLIIVEKEFYDEETAIQYKAPDWLGKEVSDVKEFKNAVLVDYSYDNDTKTLVHQLNVKKDLTMDS